MEGWRDGGRRRGEETNTNANGQEFRLEIKGDPAARRTPIHSRASLKTEGLHWVSAISVHVVPQPCDMLCRCVGWLCTEHKEDVSSPVEALQFGGLDRGMEGEG